MKILKKNNYYISIGNKSLPLHIIIDDYDNVIFEGTIHSCINYINENFANKSLIIVGPSPHLIGLNKGEEIDKYDIVIRTNNSYLINRPEDYGSRTDMLFINKMWKNNNSEKIPFLFEKYGKENVIFKDTMNLKPPKGYNINTNMDSNMGVLIILHLLNMGYKNINVCGFSFYQNHPFYLEEYYKDQRGMVLEGESHPQKTTVSEINRLVELGYVNLLEDSNYYFEIAKKKYL